VIALTARDGMEDRSAPSTPARTTTPVKPFQFGELLARVRAVLRRTAGVRAPCSPARTSSSIRRRTGSRAEEGGALTAREFALLHFLLLHAGEVVSRTRIAAAVWDHDFDTCSNVVEVYVRYLRAKIDEPSGRPLIHTVRGAGYVLREEP
jgi:two-component system copper resistance phosphate regulon response regulator CusR